MFPDFRALPWLKIKPLALFTLCAAAVLSAGLMATQTGAPGLHRLLAPVYAAQDAPRTLSPISVNNIEHIESQSLNGVGVVKIFFQPGVNISTASAQVTSISQTVLKQMPPGITPPMFIWRDAAGTSWSIDITFADKGAPIHAVAKGERMHIGAIDPDTVADSNSPPKLTLQQAASWTWTPDARTWAAIQADSVDQPATVVITGYRDGGVAFSRSQIRMTTSRDPVSAPIFYRDVPLMPSAGVNGVVSPLAPTAIHLIHWRLRDITKPESHTVLKDMPTCANCHSFSADGKTFGMDIDGPANDKGLYALVPVQKHMTIQGKDMVHWNPAGDIGKTRVGFMSQVSPDGRYVLSTFAGPALKLLESYYVTNFMDYRFLQVFFPTRGVLAWYDRSTGVRTPLPGADDPKYVQTDGVWSPDGKYIVFARAEARDPRPPGQGKATHALDANETQIQYDLYRVPFNEGKGGVAEPIAGASHNGMSNNFPKISPDGRWLVTASCISFLPKAGHRGA